MENAGDSLHTPTRKMSLRRKRSMQREGNGESPVSKKTSPVSTRSTAKTESAEDKMARNGLKGLLAAAKTKKNADSVSSDICVSQVYPTRRTGILQAATSETGFTTPKNRRLHRKTSSSEKKEQDEEHRTKELEEQRLRQHSPDTPFMSSQLCGTQECEVVWDCNSPGFSKDDLKRMCGDNGIDETTSPAIPVFVAPIPNRALFTRTRIRHNNNNSAVNTTAQLDELLQQLTAKGSLNKVEQPSHPDISNSRSEGSHSSTTITSKVLLPHTPPSSKDSQPTTPPVPVNLIAETSSQPFEVLEESHASMAAGSVDISASNSQADLGILEESAWDEDLNMAVCDISGTELIEESQTNSGKKIPPTSNIPEVINKEGKSNDSMDVFDDDIFNDTLIESTQVWEKEILEKGIENASLQMVPSRTKSVKDTDTYQKIVSDKASGAVCDKSNVNDSCFNIGTVCVFEKRENFHPPSKSLDSPNRNTVAKSIKEKPVEHSMQESISKAENPPQRRIRSSFRLTNNSETDFVSQKSKLNPHTNSFCNTNFGNKNSFTNKLPNNTSSTVTSGKSNTVPGPSMPLPRYQSIEPNLPKLQHQKPLFSGDAGNRNMEKNVGKTDFIKNSFPRSLSTGNSQGTETKLGITRPSKSEDAEGSREFEEDDEFFDSILCTLPEDEIIHGTLKNSETPKAQDRKTVQKETVVAFKNTNNSGVNSGDKSKVFGRVVEMKSNYNSAKVTNDLNRNNLGSSRGNSVPMEKGTAKSPIKSCNTGMSSVKSKTWTDTSQKSSSLSALCNFTINKDFQQEKSNSGCISDDDLFEDDVLSLIDEVESQFGSQPSAAPSSQSSQLSLSQQAKCTSEEIAKKKEEAQRRREERLKKEEMAKKEKAQYSKDVIVSQCNEIAKKREEAQRRREERLKKEEIANKEKELYSKEVVVSQSNEIAKKREEAQRRREESLKKEEMAKKEKALYSKEVAVSQCNKEVERKKHGANHRIENKKITDEIARNKEAAQCLREEKQNAAEEEARRLREEKQKAAEIVRKNESFYRKEGKHKAVEIGSGKEEVVSVREVKLSEEELAKRREEAHQNNEKIKMEEIARKKEAALKRREERQRSRQLQFYPSSMKR